MISSKYQILENLGNGRFGYVSKGICRKSQKIVAIKMEPVHDDTKPSLLKHEATVLHYLDTQKCKNIPHLYYYGLQKTGNMCIVMSYYEQGSLDKWRTYMEYEEKMHWWNTALDIIEHIHKAGIVHRDLKPQHFMRDNDHNWYLIDFGLATSYLNDSQEHIQEVPKDNLVGSPMYISWFVHGGRDVVRRDDFLSLIYLFWELIYGYFLLDEGKEIENKFSAEVIDDFNIWLRDRKEFRRFYDILESKSKSESNVVMVSFMVSLLSHAEELKFKDKPNYDLFKSNQHA